MYEDRRPYSSPLKEEEIEKLEVEELMYLFSMDERLTKHTEYLYKGALKVALSRSTPFLEEFLMKLLVSMNQRGPHEKDRIRRLLARFLIPYFRPFDETDEPEIRTRKFYIMIERGKTKKARAKAFVSSALKNEVLIAEMKVERRSVETGHGTSLEHMDLSYLHGLVRSEMGIPIGNTSLFRLLRTIISCSSVREFMYVLDEYGLARQEYLALLYPRMYQHWDILSLRKIEDVYGHLLPFMPMSEKIRIATRSGNVGLLRDLLTGTHSLFPHDEGLDFEVPLREYRRIANLWFYHRGFFPISALQHAVTARDLELLRTFFMYQEYSRHKVLLDRLFCRIIESQWLPGLELFLAHGFQPEHVADPEDQDKGNQCHELLAKEVIEEAVRIFLVSLHIEHLLRNARALERLSIPVCRFIEDLDGGRVNLNSILALISHLRPHLASKIGPFDLNLPSLSRKLSVPYHIQEHQILTALRWPTVCHLHTGQGEDITDPEDRTLRMDILLLHGSLRQSTISDCLSELYIV